MTGPFFKWSSRKTIKRTELFTGAAKHYNRSVFEESMNLCTSVLWYLNIKKQIDPTNSRHLVAAILISNMALK